MSEYSVYIPNATSRAGKFTKTLKEHEKCETKERKKSLLCLMAGYLRECNLQESADVLANEAQLINQYQICDNIDLDIILQDYQSYYALRFNKTPKIIKKIEDDNGGGDKKNGTKRRSKLSNTPSPCPNERAQSPRTQPSKTNQTFEIGVISLGELNGQNNKAAADEIEERPLPTLADFEGYSSEWREMADLITKEIVPKKLGLAWSDCVGVEKSIELLKEAVVYPLMYPDVFKGLLAPWKGILLYGPPGTGKTRLAKALAGEASTTFINLTISTFVSKWRGDSEKMLKVLFDVARLYAPSTIFIDELDALASKYEDSQHEASRRFKSELLIQLDGILGGNEQVFILATTNSPWNLNGAILRRFEKRILLNVPGMKARKDLFKYYFEAERAAFSEADFESMAGVTENYSGADIKLVCKEVLMCTFREKLGKIEGNKMRCEALRAPTVRDVKNAVARMNPSSTEITVGKYKDWAQIYGNI